MLNMTPFFTEEQIKQWSSALGIEQKDASFTNVLLTYLAAKSQGGKWEGFEDLDRFIQGTLPNPFPFILKFRVYDGQFRTAAIRYLERNPLMIKMLLKHHVPVLQGLRMKSFKITEVQFYYWDGDDPDLNTPFSQYMQGLLERKPGELRVEDPYSRGAHGLPFSKRLTLRQLRSANHAVPG
jgi:hypothetical protein